MSKITRRETLAGGGKAVAAIAVLTTLPSIAHAKEGTELLDLERRWYLAFARKNKWREAAWQAVDDLPSGQRYAPGSPFVLGTPHTKGLFNLEAQAEHEMRVIEDRMTETPARTIHGVAAKLRIGQGPVMMQAFGQSIVADVERLAEGAL